MKEIGNVEVIAEKEKYAKYAKVNEEIADKYKD